MDPRYEHWIEKTLRHVDPTGMCDVLSAAMHRDFPELIRVRGHFVGTHGMPHPHWWCKTAEGEIVDPTRSQFPFEGKYVEHPEGEEEPVGKCSNCGGYIFTSSGYTTTVCSEKCEQEYRRYLGV